MNNTSALIIAGGSHGHDFAATARALGDVLESHGLQVDIIDDPDDAWTAMLTRATPYGLLVVNGLRFRMTHPRYESIRTKWEYQTPPAADAALDHHLGAGGAVLCVHTGCICFDDWARWGDVLGRKWNWDEQKLSWHPERGPLLIEPVTGHGEPFEIVDEIYTDLLDVDSIEVLARCRGQVVMWRRLEGHNRVAVTTVGHGVDTYEHTAYRALLDELISWVTHDAS